MNHDWTLDRYYLLVKLCGISRVFNLERHYMKRQFLRGKNSNRRAPELCHVTNNFIPFVEQRCHPACCCVINQDKCNRRNNKGKPCWATPFMWVPQSWPICICANQGIWRWIFFHKHPSCDGITYMVTRIKFSQSKYTYVCGAQWSISARSNMMVGLVHRFWVLLAEYGHHIYTNK